MNEEIKAQWIAALRSGEYEQTKGELKSSTNPNAYCCLGVLCELARKDGATKLATKVYDESTVDYRYGPSEDYEDIDVTGGTLPEDVQRWAGLQTSNPLVRIPGEDYPKALIDLNDDEEYTFGQIADALEEGTVDDHTWR